MRRIKVRISDPQSPLDSWVTYLTEKEIYQYRLAGWIVAEV